MYRIYWTTRELGEVIEIQKHVPTQKFESTSSWIRTPSNSCQGIRSYILPGMVCVRGIYMTSMYSCRRYHLMEETTE